MGYNGRSHSLSLCHLFSDVTSPCHLLEEALTELRTPSSEKGWGILVIAQVFFHGCETARRLRRVEVVP